MHVFPSPTRLYLLVPATSRHQADVVDAHEPVHGQPAVRQRALLILLLDAQLVLADVHQLLSRLELRGHASFHVRFRFANCKIVIRYEL